MRLLTLLTLPSRIRNVRRIREITSVLIKHGFADIVDRLNLSGFADRSKRIFLKKPDSSFETKPQLEERIRRTFEELGATFIKLGQVMATRPDLVPMDLVLELRKLHDDVLPFPYEEAKKVIENELNKPVVEIFSNIDEKPLAAASIAQVHRASFIDGSKVVIKIQRPDVERIIKSDLQILKWIAAQIEDRIPEVRQFNPVGLVEEFSKTLQKEISFKTELHNIQRFAKNFEGDATLHIPKAYPELSSEKILIMEDVTGIKIFERQKLEKINIELHELARRGTSVMLKSIFEYGFFHADPHPGNFFIREDGSIALVDFGMMGSLDQQRIDEILSFLVSILVGDQEMLIDLLVDMDLVDENSDLRGLKAEAMSLVSRYGSISLEKIDVGNIINEVFTMVLRHRVQLPPDMLLIGRALTTMEGIAREIYPQFNPLEEIKPYIISIYFKRTMDPAKHSKNIYRGLSDLFVFLKEVPRDLRNLTRRLRKGELTLQIHDKNTDRILKQKEKLVNRCIYAFMSSVFLFAGIFSLASGGLLMKIVSAVNFFFTFIFMMILFLSLGDDSSGSRR
jgi:ubiquinone biosynthesis protein